jgi:hypothetical protein
MTLNTDTAYQPAARSSFDEQRHPIDNIQRFTNGKRMWSKAFLITFWVLQLLICIVGWAFGGFYVYAVTGFEHGESVSAIRYLSLHRRSRKTRLIDHRSVGAGIWLAWSTVCCALIVAEIVMFSRQNLKPWFAVTSHTIKTTLWLIPFLMAIRQAVAEPFGGFSLLLYGVFE